jgi:hypothetical protein
MLQAPWFHDSEVQPLNAFALFYWTPDLLRRTLDDLGATRRRGPRTSGLRDGLRTVGRKDQYI